MKILMPESGEPCTELECRRCGAKPAKGMSWVERGSSIIFKCDSCGRTMHLGYTDTSNMKQVEDKRARELAEINRSRYWREKDEQFGQKVEKQWEESRSLPEVDKYFHQRPNFDGEWKKEEINTD